MQPVLQALYIYSCPASCSLVKTPPQVPMNLETIYHLCHWANKHEEKQEVRHHNRVPRMCFKYDIKPTSKRDHYDKLF